MARTAHIVRETSESHIELSLNLDGTGQPAEGNAHAHAAL